MKSRLALAGLLFFLGAQPLARAGCADFFRRKPAPISGALYEAARLGVDLDVGLDVDLEVLNITTALERPEILLGVLSREVADLNLPQILKQEFDVERLKFGRNFEWAKWPYRILTVKRPPNLQPETLKLYARELSRFLFETKRREFRWGVRPDRYLRALDGLTQILEPLAYAGKEVRGELPAVERPQRLGAVRLALRSVLLFGPGARQLWPLTGGTTLERRRLETRRRVLHWTLSRSVGAFYLASLGMALTHVPETFETFHLLYKMRGDLIELGTDLGPGQAYDRRGETVKLIAKYERLIADTQTEMAQNPPDVARLRARIADLTEAIASLKKDLVYLP